MDCLSRLNSLQSNAKTLEMLRTSGNNMNAVSISEMEVFCKRSLDIDAFQKLPIVHVAGTKGKGSTSAFIESLFRRHGLKTGLFTSPHLRFVNERIRINGKPVSDELFESNFNHIWDMLSTNGSDKPSYFRFLTLMGFHTFVQQKVDICIIEVGVGGRYDGTNVIQHPLACVITPIGMDHVLTLGDTVSKIAHHKAGIIKPNSTVFSSEQFEESFREIEEECLAKKAKLIKCTSNHPLLTKCTITLQHQLQNATTALYAFEHVMAVLQKPYFEATMISAINLTHWPGRNQIIPFENINYFLDGAHTVESLMYCIDWFQDRSTKCKVLIFNCTPERLNATLISILNQISWDLVIFTHNKTRKEGYSSDLLNKNVFYNRDHFVQLQMHIPASLVTNCLEDAVKLVQERQKELNKDLDVLCTGSLHLVGGIMDLLDVAVE